MWDTAWVSVSERPCFLLEYSPEGSAQVHRNTWNVTKTMSLQQPPRAQSFKGLVRHPESSPCFSLVLKCNWCCPEASPVDKGFVNNVSMGWHCLWPCQAVARAGVGFMALTEFPELTAITFMTGIQRCCRSQVLHLYQLLNSHHASHGEDQESFGSSNPDGTKTRFSYKDAPTSCWIIIFVYRDPFNLYLRAGDGQWQEGPYCDLKNKVYDRSVISVL